MDTGNEVAVVVYVAGIEGFLNSAATKKKSSRLGEIIFCGRLHTENDDNMHPKYHHRFQKLSAGLSREWQHLPHPNHRHNTGSPRACVMGRQEGKEVSPSFPPSPLPPRSSVPRARR